MPATVPSREAALQQLAKEPFDLLVIGGGIVGAGVARDAAMRGLRVGLVEQNDFASGTSSRSSRLLHGGLRYLAQGHVGLVREASIEKRILHEIAPHLARPLAFLFPTYRDDPDWKLWKLKIGVKLYDALCGWHNFGRSEWLSAKDVLIREPLVQPDGLAGAVRYFDGLTNDARLVIDTLRSAARHGALVANRVRYVDANRDGGAWHCRLLDTATNASLDVRAKWIVNAAGPWGDRFRQSGLKLRLTKGVHIVIDHAKLPVKDAVVMTEERRILFAIPWAQRLIIGTTDTDHRGPIERVRCEEGDVAYLLKHVNRMFPSRKIELGDVRSAWAGLRPLIADEHGHPSDISRNHLIQENSEQWLDIGGGKLTTYRLMAQQAVDRITRERRHTSRTASEPLLVSPDATDVSGMLPPFSTTDAVTHYCRNEWAMTIEDVTVRRSGWQHYVDNAHALSRAVAQQMANELGWDASRLEQEIARYDEAVRIEFLPSTGRGAS